MVKIKEYYPTGNCFDDAAEIITDMVRQNIMNWVLVHGIHYGTSKKQIIAHAWVEHNGSAFFKGYDGEILQYIRLKAEDYRKDLDIIDHTEYRLHDLLKMHPETLSGPWVSRYKKYCRDYKDMLKTSKKKVVKRKKKKVKT